VARFILDHPNICGLCAYHTHGGLILRPSMTQPDSAMGARDLTLYQELGKVGTTLTGYPTISIYEDFTPDKSKARRGGLMDWTYGELGMISFAIELWDVEREAGADKNGYYVLFSSGEEGSAKIHDYVRAQIGERGWRPWTAFDHPQLGAVEIGGLVTIWAYRNPPPARLAEICRANTLFNLHHAAAAPMLKIDELSVASLGAGLHKIRAVIANHGYLPTNLSDIAVETGAAKPVEVSITVEGGEIVMNPATVNLGHLAGRNERRHPWSPWGQQWSASARPVEWLVRIEGAGSVTVTARSEKAGIQRQSQTIQPASDRQ
jgi:hypothetical protein